MHKRISGIPGPPEGREIHLSDHFTYRKLLRYTLPSVVMLVFTSIYGVVDGFFVSNFAGKAPFTAVNFIMPYLLILGACGFMFGTGGGALIAKLLGEGRRERANETFSLIVYSSLLCGAALAVLGIALLRPAASLLGAEGRLLEDSVAYGRIVLLAVPAYILQFEFQCLFATAERPALGLWITVAAGLVNMVLDALFVAVLPWGLAGAAAATAVSQLVGGAVPLVYFARPNGSLLRLGRASPDLPALGRVCSNGSSELMSNISMSVVSMLYNAQLLRYAGEDGVAAYGVLMYVSMIFQAVSLGYSVGTAPAVSYHYGAQDVEELKSLLRKSLAISGSFAAVMTASALTLAHPLALVFVGYDQGLLALTVRAFRIYAFSFLFSGISIFGSSFFTALNDGPVSAAISFLRTMVFQTAAVLIFPRIWAVDGIWLSIVAAEAASVAVTALFLQAKRARYGY